MTEEEIAAIVAELPVRRRIQARAALTGSVADLLELVRRAVSEPGLSRDWHATLSAEYMLDFAARHRPPEESAELARSLDGDYRETIVLDAAARRSTADLAAVASHLCPRVGGSPGNGSPGNGSPGDSSPEADPAKFALVLQFLRRLSPADLACVFSDNRDHELLLGTVAQLLCESSQPDAVARLVLHLNGIAAAEPLSCVLGIMARSAQSEDLGRFMVRLAGFGDSTSVRECAELTVAADDDVNKVAELVKAVLAERDTGLARLIVAAAVDRHREDADQYRLLALVFIFTELGMLDEAEQVMNTISATAPDNDVHKMVVQFCQSEPPEHTKILLRMILRQPTPGKSAADALGFLQGLPSVRDEIFASVARWDYANLVEFESRLSGQSNDWAQKFRDVAAQNAADRVDNKETGEIVLWLLDDRDSRRGMKRAEDVIFRVLTLHDASRLVTLISQLRAKGSWWRLRDYAERQAVELFNADDMARLIDVAKDFCLPAVLRLTAWWLSSRSRSDPETVEVVLAICRARGNRQEMEQTLTWSGYRFHRPDGSNPMRALEAESERQLKSGDPAVAESLMAARNAWFSGDKRSSPLVLRRPDPDPPPR